jgi:predicted DCC family thiol-disulfide oxidoreductase YuxK
MVDNRTNCALQRLCNDNGDMSASPAPPQTTGLTSERHPLLLFFDGECAFCNRWVNRVRMADHQHRMRFGAKQGHTFQQILQSHPEFGNVESVVLIKRRADGGEEFLVRAAAVREVTEGLPEFRFFNGVLHLFPDFLSNIGYIIFSRLRTPLFGKYHHCRVPLEEDRELYVE